MAMDFAKLGQEMSTLTPIMAGRNKLATEEIVNKVLTINGVGFAPKFDESGRPLVDENGEADTYAVVTFKELDAYFYSCGAVPTKYLKNFLAMAGTEETLNKEIEEAGGIKVMFKNAKTKSGRALTTMDFLK